jgi:16S rRNA (uracil1498-N3)-methyltransferase
MSPYDPGIRLFVTVPLSTGVEVEPSRDQTHYLKNVMRVKPGAAIRLFNGRDGEWHAKVGEVGRKTLNLSVGEQLRGQMPEPDLWICFAPLKRARIDYLAQKATELGVSALLPVITRYTNVSRVKLDRLRANAVEAAEQCARLAVPDVHEVQSLDQCLENWPSERRILLCDETQTSLPIIETLNACRDDGAAPWAIFIGPEGGYAPEELDVLRALPFVTPVGLGNRLLRADTAAVAAIACWQAVLGDWTLES